jgi:hypothetical protein
MINSPLKLEPPSQTFIDMTLNTYSHSPVPFMFHNSSDTLRIVPPLDMPTPPRLRTPRGAPGPHQDYKLLAYVMTWDDITAWVDRYKLPTSKSRKGIISVGVRALSRRLPATCAFLTVRLANGDVQPAWILASNKSEEHLRRAEDLDMIQKVRRIIGTSESPQWYRPGK